MYRPVSSTCSNRAVGTVIPIRAGITAATCGRSVNGTGARRAKDVFLFSISLVAAGVGYLAGRAHVGHAGADRPPATRITAADQAHGVRSLDGLLQLPEGEFEKLDVVELNLATAREIPACANLDIPRYQRTVDEWAARVKHEIDRYAYRFAANPSEYKNSRAYFNALVMTTVIGQDYHVRYDTEGFAFDKPEDLFIHGVIDERKGTCVSLPLIYVAIGQRLGFPIHGVAVPGHTFCRWDDPATGERLNIEAANQGGLTDHPDDYYRHWPFGVDPRWERDHHVLASLTLRQYAAVMIGALASYYQEIKDLAQAARWYALAVSVDPADRSEFIGLRLLTDALSPRFLDADELKGRKPYWQLQPHPSLLSNRTYTRDLARGTQPARATLPRKGAHP